MVQRAAEKAVKTEMFYSINELSNWMVELKRKTNNEREEKKISFNWR